MTRPIRTRISGERASDDGQQALGSELQVCAVGLGIGRLVASFPLP
jgi:hypothetical protein